MKKKKSKRKIIILIIVLVIAALLIIGYININAAANKLLKTTYDIVDVDKGTVEVKVKGAGAVAPLYDDTVYSSFSGKVKEILAQDGDVVKADDIIVTFTSDTLESEYDILVKEIEDIDTAISMLRNVSGSDYVLSPIEGIVKVLYAQKGDNVDAVVDMYGALAVICPDNIMQAEIEYDGDLSLEDSVTVTIDSDSVDGEVYGIDGRKVTVRFEDDDYNVGDSVVVSAQDGTQMGSGAVQIANPVYISAKGGVIEKIYENTGDEVKRGGKLFSLDGEILSAELYSQIELRKEKQQDLAEVKADMNALAVRAGTDGVVTALELNKEQLVQEGTPLFTIQSNEQIKLDVEIDELDIANISLETLATVTFEAIPEKEYTGKVVKINPIGVSVNNVTNFTITLQIEEAKEVLIGMSADVDIVSQKAEDVLVIPIEAIQIKDGEKFVVFEEDVDEDLMSTPATHKITTGITDGVIIEVLEGLKQGDRIAVPQAKEFDVQSFMMNGGAREDENGDSRFE